jgi:hypothetical protein
MLRVVHEAAFARHGALRVLSFAVAHSPPNARRLVEAGGLKGVFPAFMGKGAWRGRESGGGARDAVTSCPPLAAVVVTTRAQASN